MKLTLGRNEEGILEKDLLKTQKNPLFLSLEVKPQAPLNHKIENMNSEGDDSLLSPNKQRRLKIIESIKDNPAISSIINT